MIAALIVAILAAVVNLVLFFVGGAIVGPIEIAMAPGDPVTVLRLAAAGDREGSPLRMAPIQ